MKPRFTEFKLTVLSTSVLLLIGCGPANEGALKGESKPVATKPEMQNVNSYGDLVKFKMNEAKEKTKGTSKGSQ